MREHNNANDIAQVRTRADLEIAIFRVLDKTMHTKLTMLRVIDEDGLHMSPYMFDSTLFETAKAHFDKLAGKPVTIEETYNSQVLATRDGIMFNIEEELEKGSVYAQLWKTTGLKNVYGLPLRAGEKNIGTIWLLANRLS